jgi:hypothetical protein
MNDIHRRQAPIAPAKLNAWQARCSSAQPSRCASELEKLTYFTATKNTVVVIPHTDRPAGVKCTLKQAITNDNNVK